MIQDIQDALAFLPQHRKRSGKRAEGIHLDALIDERRMQEKLRHGVYDLVMMSYRYRALALREIQKFLGPKKKLKPMEMEDLLCLGFAALLSRDKTPGPVLVDAFVEAGKKTWGRHCAGLFNAFFRRVLRSKDALYSEISEKPAAMLPEKLQRRWDKHPELLEFVGSQIRHRPQSGVSAFTKDMEFQNLSLEDWREKDVFQAMDTGSWQLCEWVWEQLEDSKDLLTPDKGESFRLLDSCAAPGGKLIYFCQKLKNSPAPFEALATDASFARLETLKENIARWSLSEQVKTQLKKWGQENTDESPSTIEQADSTQWSLVLADLPCSGSGTVFSRPDVLTKDFASEEKSLFELQSQILTELSQLKTKTLCVSVCSVDPKEIDHIHGVLRELFGEKVARQSPLNGQEGFYSWRALNSSLELSEKSLLDDQKSGQNLSEGLVAWWIEP